MRDYLQAAGHKIWTEEWLLKLLSSELYFPKLKYGYSDKESQYNAAKHSVFTFPL